MKRIRVGSRESVLAVIQSEIVMDYIKENCPDMETELVTMKTTGDRILDRRLDKVGGKGLFVKELDHALLEDRTDLSVHSLKDMPMEVPEALPLIGFSERADPRDVLVLPEGTDKIDFSKPVGCASNRRRIQFQRLYPEAVFKPIRGNVQTRLRKVDSGEYSATILAAAGLKRLGLEHRISRYFSVNEMIPAAGQGVLAIQGRKGMDYRYLNGFFDKEARFTSQCERAFVTELHGGCSSPIAAYAKLSGGYIVLTGLYCDEEKQEYLTGTESCAIAAETEEASLRIAELAGRELAVTLKRRLGEEKGVRYEQW